MSMNLESELRMNLKAMTYDMQSPNPFKSLDEKKAIIERYVQDLLDMLQESYGQVPELGERGNDGERESCGSRWRELFGTPERAALTLGDYCFNMVSCTECGIGCEGKRFEDGDALLEWLKQEVDA
ncbi:MAG: hypothetical protein IJ131_09735 [Eggerthellaceae bacterium]|nr:hypothetical protein [Eggerthellaceae bacterium]